MARFVHEGNGDSEHAADVRDACFGNEGVILACLEVSIDAGADEANRVVADIVAGVGVPVTRVPKPENDPLGWSVTRPAT